MPIHSGMPAKNWSNSYGNGQELAKLDSQIGGMSIKTSDGLKSEYEVSSRNLESQGVVKDATGCEISLQENVKDAVNSGKMMYNESNGQVLGSIPQEIEKNVKDLERKHSDMTNSTVFRAIDEVGKNGTEVGEEVSEIIQKIRDKF